MFILVDNPHSCFCIDIPTFHRVNHQLSLKVNIVIVCFGTSAVSQLAEFTIPHIIAVRVFKRHHRPHAGNIMIKESTFFKVNRIVKIKTNEFGVYVEVYVFINLRIYFCCCIIAFVIIVTVTEVTVLIQVTARNVVLQFFCTSVQADIVFI